MKRKREDNEGIALDAKTDVEPPKKEKLKVNPKGNPKGNLNEITDNVDKLYEDFKNIETLAKEEALRETIATAYKDDNLAHNRYADIGQYEEVYFNWNELCVSVPYDGKIVTLQTPAGQKL